MNNRNRWAIRLLQYKVLVEIRVLRAIVRCEPQSIRSLRALAALDTLEQCIR